MKVIIFGATGMVGQGVLLECLKDPDVTRILTVGRSKTGRTDPKLTEIVHTNFDDFSSVLNDFRGYDACFYCLGVTSLGMSEQTYRHVTYDYTVCAAKALSVANPNMTFILVTGAGTDSTEKGGIMWARVKGAAENAVLAMPFKAAYLFRPAAIQPEEGITSRTIWIKLFLVLFGFLLPFFLKRYPQYVTTTGRIGRAMLKVVREGAPKKWIESSDINELGQ
jgi:uncharacterized protein YbjT (DUF2867 family)